MPNPSSASGQPAAPQTPETVAPRRGLAWKVFGFTFPVITLIILATQATVGYLDYAGQMADHVQRAEMTARLTAVALSKSVWNLDQAVYQSQIRAIEEDPNLVRALLTDENGQVLFAMDRGQAEGRTIQASASITEPGGTGKIGDFTLVISTHHLVVNAYRQAGIAVAAILVLLVGFVFTLHSGLRHLVKKPLDRLLAAMARVENKDWHKVDWRSEDEIGLVTARFNRMVDALRSGDEAQRLLAQLEQAQAELLEKNQALTKANRLILESIQYARRIQTSMLPDKRALGDAVQDIHVCWEPLHLVGGDYFWLERFDDQSLLAVVDCTGHGVPGAFMTLVVASALDRILHEEGRRSPAEILRLLDEMVRARLRQDQPDSDSDDGLEAAICLWNATTGVLTYAGAGLPLIWAQGGQVEEIRGDRARLGYRSIPPKTAFTDHRIAVEPGTAFYMLTDGIPDHMGGQPPRLFGRRRLIQTIAGLEGLSMAEQLERIESELRRYRGDQHRRDDMTLIGFVPR